MQSISSQYIPTQSNQLPKEKIQRFQGPLEYTDLKGQMGEVFKLSMEGQTYIFKEEHNFHHNKKNLKTVRVLENMGIIDKNKEAKCSLRNLLFAEGCKAFFPTWDIVPATKLITVDNLEGKKFGSIQKYIDGVMVSDLQENEINPHNPVLNKELIKLQIVDFLFRNPDRHKNNYIIERNTSKEISGIKGIDNELCFCEKDNGAEIFEPDGNRYLGLPSCIDKSMYSTIMNISEKDMDTFGGEHLTQEEKSANLNRLGLLKNHCNSLMKQGMVIEEEHWGKNIPPRSYVERDFPDQFSQENKPHKIAESKSSKDDSVLQFDEQLIQQKLQKMIQSDEPPSAQTGTSIIFDNLSKRIAQQKSRKSTIP